MSAQPSPHITPEQYLDLDRAAEVRSEYYDGVMYMMLGGSFAHCLIATNASAELHQALRERGCCVLSSDMRVRLNQRTYVYSDVTVVCGEPKIAGQSNDILMNPTIVVEVLSPSSESNDRGLKFARYRGVESLQEYVLVSQTEPRVEVFRRQPTGQWLFTEFVGVDAVCRLDSADCEIPLSGIYLNVTFPVEEDSSAEITL